jgi:hypothetical protein
VWLVWSGVHFHIVTCMIRRSLSRNDLFGQMCSLSVNSIFTHFSTLHKFRVSDEGFNNRFRNRQHLAPHTDHAYAVVYPGKDNSDYTSDANQRSRRLNKMSERYDIMCKVNGDFHVKVLNETPE